MSRSHCYIRVQLCRECIFFPRSWCLARVVHPQNKGRCNSQAHTRHYSKCQYWNIFHCGYGKIRIFSVRSKQIIYIKRSPLLTLGMKEVVEKWHFVFIYSLTPFVASTLFNRLVCLFVCLFVCLCLCFFAAIGLMKECMTIHKTLIHLRVLKDFLTIKDRYVSKE